ncbi:MAG: hypothetical protein RMY28_016490 [Nostoc sp. ChiSLP01]
MLNCRFDDRAIALSYIQVPSLLKRNLPLTDANLAFLEWSFNRSVGAT